MQKVKMPNLTFVHFVCSERVLWCNEFTSWMGSLKNPALVEAEVVASECGPGREAATRQRVKETLTQEGSTKELKLTIRCTHEPRYLM
jgi:hypothetical protein